MMIYLSLSGQPKHARDIAAILRVKKNELDFGCIDGWVMRLELGSVWREMLDSVG